MADERFHFHTDVRVRLPETDAMGVVFHGNFFTYMEVGRVDYLRNLGLNDGMRPIKDFDNVVVSAHCDFRSPARLDDKLVISVRVREIRERSFTFQFRMTHAQQNRLVATGTTTHCAIDESFQPMRVPDEFRRTVSTYEGFELTG